MTDQFQDELRALVASAKNKRDLEPLLPYVSLDQLKHALYQTIDEVDDTAIKMMRFDAVSIHKIIPSDIIQHILSFQGLDLKHAKCVNKKWNELSIKNEKKSYLALQQRLEQDSPIPYDKSTNNTWILDSERNQLTQVEKEFGFKLLPRSTKKDMMSSIDMNGDRILVFSRIYKGTKSFFDKDLSMIGINVKKRPEINAFAAQFGDGTMMEIDIGCKLWVDGCRIFYTGSVGVKVNRNSSLYITNCAWKCMATAIKVNMNAKQVIIKDSVFRNCCRCIEMAPNERNLMIDDDEKSTVRLKCDGNIFRDINHYPIAVQPPNKGYIDKTELYQLKNNSLEDNEILAAKQIENANLIYVIEDD